MAICGNQWEMAAVSHRDSDQRSVRVTLCPTGEDCQPTQPHSKSEEINTAAHSYSFSISFTPFSFYLFQLSEHGTKRSKREARSAYPLAEASVTVLAPRKVSHLLVRQTFAL